MTKTIPDKAEVALEYPDKLYIGTFERTARFDAHPGISLSLERRGGADERKTIRMHFHYGLFAEILRDLAKTASAVDSGHMPHRDELREAAKELYEVLGTQETVRSSGKQASLAVAQAGEANISKMSPEEEVLLLHVLE